MKKFSVIAIHNVKIHIERTVDYFECGIPEMIYCSTSEIKNIVMEKYFTLTKKKSEQNGVKTIPI
jgi:hypothetical protein